MKVYDMVTGQRRTPFHAPYPAKARIDATVACKNNAGTVERCVCSIRENIAIRRLIVVDNGSTDDTPKIAKRCGAIVMRQMGMLGSVRYAQALACKTKWVAYIDSDVYLYPSWWPEVSRFIKSPDVGMVLGFCDAPLSRLRIYDEYLKYLAREHGAVAFSNTLIRRNLVLECGDQLKRIHFGEDDVVAAHVREKGLRIVTVPKALSFHDKDPFISHPRDYFRAGQSLKIRWGFWGFVVCAFSLRTALLNWSRFSLGSRRLSIKLLGFLLMLWLWMVAGLMKTGNPSEGTGSSLAGQ